MDCPKAKQNLVAYLDGALSAAEAAELETHLSGCDACRREKEALARAVKASRALPVAEPSHDFSRRFFERFSGERKSPLFSWWAGRVGRLVLVAAGGAAAIGLGAVLVFSGPRASEEEKILARHLELFSDYEVISLLPVLEDLEFIEAMDENG